MHVYVYMYSICAYGDIYTCTYVYMCICIPVYPYTCIRIHVYMCICVAGKPVRSLGICKPRMSVIHLVTWACKCHRSCDRTSSSFPHQVVHCSKSGVACEGRRVRAFARRPIGHALVISDVKFDLLICNFSSNYSISNSIGILSIISV